jgi:hypothetical protein
MKLRAYLEGNTSALTVSILYPLLRLRSLYPKKSVSATSGHMLQQAGYQKSSVLVAPRILPQAHAFRNTSQYLDLYVALMRILRRQSYNISCYSEFIDGLHLQASYKLGT